MQRVKTLGENSCSCRHVPLRTCVCVSECGVCARCSYNALCVLKDSFARLKASPEPEPESQSQPQSQSQSLPRPRPVSVAATGSFTHWKIPNTMTHVERGIRQPRTSVPVCVYRCVRHTNGSRDQGERETNANRLGLKKRFFFALSICLSTLNTICVWQAAFQVLQKVAKIVYHITSGVRFLLSKY